MKDSGKNWVVNMEIIRKKAKKFAQFFISSKPHKTLKVGDNSFKDEKELDNLIGDDY